MSFWGHPLPPVAESQVLLQSLLRRPKDMVQKSILLQIAAGFLLFRDICKIVWLLPFEENSDSLSFGTQESVRIFQ